MTIPATGERLLDAYPNGGFHVMAGSLAFSVGVFVPESGERPGVVAELRALKGGHRPGACSVRRNWYRPDMVP